MLRGSMNTLLNNMLNDLNRLSQKPLVTNKKSSVTDSGDIYLAEFELAGFCKKDVSINVVDNVLEIKAENKDRSEEFKLHLNDLVSPDHISAELRYGLLKITLPKKAINEAKKIEIK